MIIAGDFNGVDDGIGEMLGSAGFVSVAPKSIGMITHLTHLNTRICADFIWYRANGNKGSCQKKKFSSIRASTFALLPEGVEYTSWPADYVLSDHRPLIANFEFEDD